ncbi:MAG: hypothetical protein O3C60_20500 [Planctomycetota bacterium]|nr:hypothetical protein [Planctomycetota bacterium]
MTHTDYSDDTLVEQPAIALFAELGYETANCFYEKVGGISSTLAGNILQTGNALTARANKALSRWRL